MLFTYGIGYIWISQTVGRPEILIHSFYTKSKILSIIKLAYKVVEMSKAEHHKNFKTLPNVAKYLSIDISYKYRRVLANFRCSAHNFMIEKGRHLGIDRNFRNCPICLKRNVYVNEDEFHFMIVCPEYEPSRYDLFPDEKLWNISLNLFYSFVKTEDANKIRKLSQFLSTAFKNE